MSATLDTSHCPIGPCGVRPSKQLPSIGDCSRHASTALLSSALDRGGGWGGSAEFNMLGQVEGNDDSMRANVHIVFGSVRV